VVVYSMTTSSPADAPRGMEFPLQPQRFNVATSRAAALRDRGSPRLFEPECKTPKGCVSRTPAAAISSWRRS